MYSGYGFFARTEIWNNARVLAYMQGNMAYGFKGLRHANTSINVACGCETALPLFCDQGAGDGGEYISPALDSAPWYDPDDPASSEFAGLFVENVDGFDAVVSRDFSEGAILGSSLGPLKLKGRCITVTGWLRAKTCCGAEYGLRWLQEALLGDGSCQNCDLSDLMMLKCCPPDDDTCHISDSITYDVDTTQTVTVTVTDDGFGLYTIVIDDPNQINAVSDPTGLANNTDGFIPLTNTALEMWKISLTDVVGSNADNFLTVPYPTVTSFITAPSGGGASATISIDTTVTSDCEDEQNSIDALPGLLADFITAHGSGVPTALYAVGFGYTYEFLSGINPLDYIRLFHRTGLTDGPKVIDRLGTCCATCGCTNLKVQFTLCSELPYIYSDIDWCADEAPFPATEYCLNLRSLCGQCSTPLNVKRYERQVARPACNIVLRHDQSWCADGWDILDGCPPEDCILTISGTEDYPGDDPSCAGEGSPTSGTCTITLANDGTWTEDGWSVADGFPPPYCNLTLTDGGECNEADPPPDPPEEPCLVRVTYDECTGEKTWEPIRWSGDVPFPVDCPCVEIAETCLKACDHPTPCVIRTECPVLINCFGAWTPVGWDHDTHAVFPDPNCTYTIANVQDETPLTEIVEIPVETFVPDCGPVPIQPPAPFLISTSCYCEPWVTRRLCCTFTNPGDWNDATSYIEINTGSAEMRRLKIAAYQNPFGEAVPCPCDPNDTFWECRTPCATILVPQLPSGARLIIDSRLRIAQLVLPGGRSVNAMRYIFSEDGTPFGWFDIGACSTFCIVASVDAQFVADDATISIGMVNKYLASGW